MFHRAAVGGSARLGVAQDRCSEKTANAAPNSKTCETRFHQMFIFVGFRACPPWRTRAKSHKYEHLVETRLARLAVGRGVRRLLGATILRHAESGAAANRRPVEHGVPRSLCETRPGRFRAVARDGGRAPSLSRRLRRIAGDDAHPL